MFTHFIPSNWYHEVSGLPSIMLDCIEIARFLAFKSNNILYIDEDDPNRLKKVLDKSQKELQKINKHYAKV